MMSWGDRDIPRQEPQRNQLPKQSFADALRAQFRALVKVITGQQPSPSIKKRRERKDAGGGFRAAALLLFRRVIRMPFSEVFNPSWDTHTWLRIWDYNEADNAGFYDHSNSAERHDSGLSPRL